MQQCISAAMYQLHIGCVIGHTVVFNTGSQVRVLASWGTIWGQAKNGVCNASRVVTIQDYALWPLQCADCLWVAHATGAAWVAIGELPQVPRHWSKICIWCSTAYEMWGWDSHPKSVASSRRKSTSWVTSGEGVATDPSGSPLFKSGKCPLT